MLATSFGAADGEGSTRLSAARTIRSTWPRSIAVAVLMVSISALDSRLNGRRSNHPHAGVVRQLPVLGAGGGIGDQRVDRPQFAQMRQCLPAELRMIGHHNHLV